MRNVAFALAVLLATIPVVSAPISQTASTSTPGWVVPKPIAGGDFLPDLPHHRAGIIHQYYPVAPPIGDGPWAEPNGMTDFNGLIVQVFMGGTAVDNHGKQSVVDVDNRVYRGEYVGTDGRHAWGTFCEI